MVQKQMRFIIHEKQNEEEINEKWKEFKELVETICREQLVKIHKEAPRKLEKILKNERVQLSSEETSGQEPEAFTRQYIIEPILRFLGYSLPRETILKSSTGRKTPDYGIKINEEKIMIEAEPLASDLEQKGHGAKQVAEWLDRRSFGIDVGIATNGLEWILLKWDDVSKSIKEISRENICKIFLYVYSSLYKSQQRILEISEEEAKNSFATFYSSFSEKYIIFKIQERERILEETKKRITKKFYDEFLKWVFGSEERKDKSGKIVVEKVTNECIIDKIITPDGGNEIDRRKFALIFMNRLIFIKFLEDKGIVSKGFLVKLYKNWEKTSPLLPFYEARLRPLFYKVFNTKEKDREAYIRNNSLYKDIPYLNGGLFRENIAKEKKYNIPDNDIVKKIIDFLEEYDFTLSENGGENEISPDILGYIYEKLINLLTSGGKKSIGAYYTPDEITRFICKNTIEPVVLNKIKKVLKEKFNWTEKDLSSYNTLDEALNPQHPISHSPKVWEIILEELNNIKILDPACGSGHFLLSALDEIVHIKKRIYDLIGKEIDLFKMKLETIVNNLYGVDIDASAVEIAKLRLWLSLIENVEKDDIKILPNIEYNVVEGNSLIGYDKKFAIDAKLEEEILKEIKKLWDLKSQYATESDVEKSKKLREEIEKLNKRLRPFLDHTYHDDLERRGLRISFNELLELKPFHWSFEFYGVFFDINGNRGFDIIIGNPPHGNILRDIEKKWAKLNYSYSNPSNIADVFIERAYNLIKNDGKIGYILPKTIAFYTTWDKARKLLINKMSVEKVLDAGIAFENVNAEQLGIIASKGYDEDNNCKIFIGQPLRRPKRKEIIYVGEVPQQFMQHHNIIIFRPFTDLEREIISHINTHTEKFRKVYIDAFRGLYLTNERKKRLKSGKTFFINYEPSIQQYYIKEWINIEIEEDFKREAYKILKPKLLFKVLRGNRIVVFCDEDGVFLSPTNVNNVFLKEGDKNLLLALEVIFNSSLISYYAQKMLFSETTESARHWDDPYVGELPLRVPSKKSRKIFSQVAIYLHFMRKIYWDKFLSKKRCHRFIEKVINYFLMLADYLVYEIYFNEIFQKDGIASLEGVISKHLETIRYDEWKELYWKKQVHKLTNTERKRLEELELENMETIKRIYISLNNDEIKDIVDKIKAHEWVRTVENFFVHE